jgi:hypothetical protein
MEAFDQMAVDLYVAYFIAQMLAVDRRVPRLQGMRWHSQAPPGDFDGVFFLGQLHPEDERADAGMAGRHLRKTIRQRRHTQEAGTVLSIPFRLAESIQTRPTVGVTSFIVAKPAHRVREIGVGTVPHDSIERPFHDSRLETEDELVRQHPRELVVPPLMFGCQ